MSTGTDSGVLIVGAGQAGLQIASSLREYGYPGPVTMIGDEPHAPYQRPPLSKAFLLDEMTPHDLHFRSADFYASNAIELISDDRVCSLEVGADGCGRALTRSGQSVVFDRLALATGARPRQLDIEGAKLRGIRYLRDTDDAFTLRAELRSAGRVVVVGGGFIGLEVAASARRMGCEVTVILADDRLLKRSVGAVTSEFFLRAHNSRGVEVHVSVQPTRLLAGDGGAVRAVELADGRVLPAELVVVGIGAQPRTELAEVLGMHVDDGIRVDEFCLTSDGHTVAAGDCVNCPNPNPALFEPERVRFESVSTAIEQARSAAATIAGRTAPYRSVPWFWSDQYDLKLQVAGLSTGFSDWVLRGDPVGEKFAILYYRGAQLIAADCVNRPADFTAVRSALAKGASIPIDRASDLGVTLKSLIGTSGAAR